MNYKENILATLKEITHRANKLYSYLYDLAYEGKIRDIKFLETIFSLYLTDERSEIKRVSIYGLLFVLKIKQDNYKKIVLNYLADVNSSLSLQLMCISGLAEAYFGTEDSQILSIFNELFNEEEDDDLKAQCFIGLMKLVGLSSLEIAQKNNGTIVIALDDIEKEKFSEEFEKIERITHSSITLRTPTNRNGSAAGSQ